MITLNIQRIPTAFFHRRVSTFIILWVVLFIYSYPTLNYPFSMDSIHLIRPYSLQQLNSAWTGHWDPDNIETPGLRPLVPIFFYGEWFVFRSSALLQRLGLMTLAALTFTVFTELFILLTGDKALSIAASILAATSMSSFYHITFLSDGVHLAALLFLVISTSYCLKTLDNPAWYNWIGFAGFYILALLTREESISWTVAILGTAILFLGNTVAIIRKWRLLLYIGFFLLFIVGIYFYFRTTLLTATEYPNALLLHPAGCSFGQPNFFRGIQSAFLPFDILGRNTVYIIFIILLGVSLVVGNPGYRFRAIILLVIVLGTIAHTAIYYRSNLLYCSVPFVALLIVSSVWEIFSQDIFRWLVVILFCLLGTLSAYQRQINFHPQSISSLVWDLDLQRGINSGAGADPKVAAQLKERLNRYNLLNPDGTVNDDAKNELILKTDKEPAIRWFWNIPDCGVFKPAKDAWW